MIKGVLTNLTVTKLLMPRYHTQVSVNIDVDLEYVNATELNELKENIRGKPIVIGAEDATDKIRHRNKDVEHSIENRRKKGFTINFRG